MNSCCAIPVEAIAADQHKTADACCLVTDKTSAPAIAECPVSKTRSRRVQRRTLEHLLKPNKRDSIKDAQYYYCTHPDCEIVYFSVDPASSFTTGDVMVKVFSKDKGDDVNVCYCYDWTRARIREELKKTGASTAAISIAKLVKAGTCTCDVRNPKGECCLGDVNAVVKQAMAGRLFSEKA